MGAPYPQELRDRVLAAYDRGMMTQQIAELFQISPAWARRIKQRRRETGKTSPRPMGGARVIEIDMKRLAALVEKKPDATLRELRSALGIQCAESAICLALKRLGLTFKKRQSMQRSKTARTLRGVAKRGATSNRASTQKDWYS